MHNSVGKKKEMLHIDETIPCGTNPVAAPLNSETGVQIPKQVSLP